MSGPVEIILIVAVIGYILARRLMGEPAEARRMLILPLVLSIIGLTDLGKGSMSGIAIVFLVGSAAVSVLIGALRGLSVRVYDHNGIVFVRYTWLTIVLWVTNIVVKFGGNFLLAALNPAAGHQVSNGLLLTLGPGLLAEGLVVLAKAMRSEGQIVWQKGRDGRPHQSSGFLDQLQQQFRGNPGPQDYNPGPRDYDGGRPGYGIGRSGYRAARRDRRRDYRDR